MAWLAQERPELVKRYEHLYARGTNASPSYRRAFEERVRPLLDKHGFGAGSRHRSRSRSGVVPGAGSGSESGWGEPDPASERFRRPAAPLPAVAPGPDQQTLF